MAYASVNTVYKTVQDFAQKENRGFVTPSQFNNFAVRAQQELFNEKISAYRSSAALRKRRIEHSQGAFNSIDAIRDDLQTLLLYNQPLTFDTDGFLYPDDYVYGESVVYAGDSVDTTDPTDFLVQSNSFLSPPSTSCPLAMLGTDKIYFSPDSVTSDVGLTYYKRPQGTDNSGNRTTSSPNWAYSNVSGQPVYNATNTINFELPKHLEPELTSMILSYMGISIREIEVVQYAENEQAKEGDNRK